MTQERLTPAIRFPDIRKRTDNIAANNRNKQTHSLPARPDAMSAVRRLRKAGKSACHDDTQRTGSGPSRPAAPKRAARDSLCGVTSARHVYRHQQQAHAKDRVAVRSFRELRAGGGAP